MPEEQAVSAWEFDVSTLKMKDKRVLAQAGREGDDDKLIPLLMRTCKRWPYAGDPADVAVYEELTLREFQEATLQFVEAIKSHLGTG